LLPQYDWVHGAGTDSWEAVNLSRKIEAKCHIHLEGVAYWRIGVNNAVDWGYNKNHSTEEIEAYRKHYKSWMSAASGADSCSVNGVNQVKTIEENLFEGKKLPNCHIISCGADARYAMALPEYKQENYIITVSRLEPNKKVFKIAEALALLKKQGVDVPPWVIVGYGSPEQVQRLADIITPADIKCRLIYCFGAEKWRWIKRAKLMLCGWMGIPPAEGLLCDVPVLSFDHPDIIEMYDNSIFWAKDNDIEEYAVQILNILSHSSYADIAKKTIEGKHQLLNGKLYACTQQQAAKKYEEIFRGIC
jgi:glycosyltransferase involved in cell wall biosynthesis